MKRLWSVALDGIFLGWIILLIFSVGHTFYKIFRGDASTQHIIIYCAGGGFVLGTFLMRLMAQRLYKKALKGVSEDVLTMIRSTNKRVAPLRKKANREFELFMECIEEGRLEEAHRHSEEAKRLNDLIEVVANEQIGLTDEEAKKEEETSG